MTTNNATTWYWIPRRGTMQRIIEGAVKANDLNTPEYIRLSTYSLFDDIEKIAYGDPSYRMFNFNGSKIAMVYNDYVCIAAHKYEPHVLAIFASELGIGTKNFGKGFMTELAIIVKLYGIRMILRRECIILANVPFPAYWPIISAVLRDDMVAAEPVVRKKPKKPERGKIKYVPAYYNEEYARWIKLGDLHYRKIRKLLFDGPYADESMVEKKQEIYRMFQFAINSRRKDIFIAACMHLCRYHYIYVHDWNDGSNRIVSPIDFKRDMKTVYLVKAFVAALKESNPKYYTYLMTKTRAFNNVEFEGLSYAQYMKYHDRTKGLTDYGTYYKMDPRWEAAQERSYRLLSSEDAYVQESIDHIFLDAYRRAIYDRETYDDYFNYDPEHTQRY